MPNSAGVSFWHMITESLLMLTEQCINNGRKVFSRDLFSRHLLYYIFFHKSIFFADKKLPALMFFLDKAVQ